MSEKKDYMAQLIEAYLDTIPDAEKESWDFDEADAAFMSKIVGMAMYYQQMGEPAKANQVISQLTDTQKNFVRAMSNVLILAVDAKDHED